MDQDRSIRVNWGVVNVPTILTTIGGVIGIIVAIGSYSAKIERIDARLDVIEESRAERVQENEKRLEAINSRIETNSRALSDITSSIKQVEYRLTVNEAAIINANQRMDRFADVIGELREGLSKLNTGVELLNQKLETAFPGPGSNGK